MMINTEFATCPTCGGDLLAHAHSDLEMLESGDIIVTQAKFMQSDEKYFSQNA